MKPQFGWMLSPRDVNPWTYRGAEGGGGVVASPLTVFP